ncbi:unnamed protein product, partial [Protopolystoma xenopodis]
KNADVDASPSDGDAKARFDQLTSSAVRSHLRERIARLTAEKAAWQHELDYMRQELLEFNAHLKHLNNVKNLMPDKGTCFYIGREIE